MGEGGGWRCREGGGIKSPPDIFSVNACIFSINHDNSNLNKDTADNDLLKVNSNNFADMTGMTSGTRCLITIIIYYLRLTF